MVSWLVDFVSWGRGITFCGSVASVGRHFTCYLEPHNGFYSNHVAFDVAVRAGQDSKCTGKPLPLAFFSHLNNGANNCP